MAGLPQELIGRPDDALSEVLRAIRLTAPVQFCLAPSGSWRLTSRPGIAAGTAMILFHIVVEGTCWLEYGGARRALVAGDVILFPFDSVHDLGVGDGRLVISPGSDLPPRPWPGLPVLRYGEGAPTTRLLCGYLDCEAVNFAPLRRALPDLFHLRSEGRPGLGWLRATIAQLAAEVDAPRPGSRTMLERLTEIAFVEVIRSHILDAGLGGTGWLAALADPVLARCLALIHGAPERGWTLAALAAGSGLSRSALAERFEAVLGTSPMRYVREWRLYRASVALGSTDRPISRIADEAGYGTVAAFSRAFARAFGRPPATWWQAARGAAP